MQRNVFEKIPMEGFRTTKAETISICNNGQRLFVGTNDGALVAYDCQTSLSSYSKFNCHILSTIRNQQKEKKSVSNLTVVEAWGVMVGIVDGMITAFDMNTFFVKATLPDTKGCHTYAISEYNDMIVVGNKRKISAYSWVQASSATTTAASTVSGGFALRKEVSNLAELPKHITCISSSVVVGFKRTYEVMDIYSLVSTKMLDVDKDQRMLSLEIPPSDLRPLSILLSHGNQGLLYDYHKFFIQPTASLSPTRLEWSSAPVSIHHTNPFIFSILQDSVEIHDTASLSSLQRIPLPVPSSSLPSFSSSSNIFSYTACKVDPAIGLDHIYVSTGDQVFVFRMTPLPAQIMSLLDAYRFEDAINLCILCHTNPQLRDIDVAGVHEKYALSLFQKGEFDNAMYHYIKADATPQKVLPLFPDLVPVVFYGYMGISSQPSKSSAAKMTGVVLTRAAAAMVTYCNHYRLKLKSKIEVADRSKAASMTAASALENLETLVISDWEDVLRIAEVIDTVLLCALINCSPSRRNIVIDFLSNTSPINRCHVESSATMLASQGNAYSEALLWIYRSHHEHKRVLVALTEERCVSAGAWSREQFYTWTADYLRWLWFHEDSSLPALVLNALRPVLEYDAELGVSVLTKRPRSHDISPSPSISSMNHGGKGIEISEVLSYLESAKLKAVVSLSASQRKAYANSSDESSSDAHIFHADAPKIRYALVHNKALCMAYVEWRINQGVVPSYVHDDYIRMLIQSIVVLNDAVGTIDHTSSDIDVKAADNDMVIFYKIFRKKLQYFLQTSPDYHAEQLLSSLPPHLSHEHALILSKLSRHEEVLQIYVNHIHDLQLAESYCEHVYQRLHEQNIYLTLIQVLLQSSSASSKKVMNIDIVVKLAEKHFDCIDAIAFLKELPPHTPFALLANYLKLVIEVSSTKKRNMQVIHQLLRVQEVYIRTGQYDT